MSGPGVYRLGLLVIENDPIPELELRPLPGDGVAVVAVRFALSRGAGQIYLGEHAANVVPRAMRTGLRTLGRIGVDAVGLCFTSSSVFDPQNFDRAFAEEAHRVDSRWDVSTAALSIVAELRARGLQRPVAVIPPWFSEPTIEAVGAYLACHGITWAGAERFELDSSWDTIARQDRFDRGAGWAVEPEALVDLVADRLDASDADAIVVPGSGFRSAEAAGQVERVTGLPLISANGALLRQLTCGPAATTRGMLRNREELIG